jgi:hypothetical protein
MVQQMLFRAPFAPSGDWRSIDPANIQLQVPRARLGHSVFTSDVHKTLGAPSIPRILRNGWEGTMNEFKCKHLD